MTKKPEPMDKRICPDCGKDCLVDLRGLHLTGAAKESHLMEYRGSRAIASWLALVAILLLLIGVCLMVSL